MNIRTEGRDAGRSSHRRHGRRCPGAGLRRAHGSPLSIFPSHISPKSTKINESDPTSLDKNVELVILHRLVRSMSRNSDLAGTTDDRRRRQTTTDDRRRQTTDVESFAHGRPVAVPSPPQHALLTQEWNTPFGRHTTPHSDLYAG